LKAQAEVKKDEGLKDESLKDENPKDESKPSQEAVAVVKCVHCGESMTHDALPKFSRVFGIVILVTGLLLSLFMALRLGLPMGVIGTYMSIANKAVWRCRVCGAVVDRIES